MEADDLQPGTAHTILRESVLSHTVSYTHLTLPTKLEV